MRLQIVVVLINPATARTGLDAALVAMAVAPDSRIEAFHARVTPESLIMPSEEVMTPTRRRELDAMSSARSLALQHAVSNWAAAVPAGQTIVQWHETEGESVDAVVASRARTADLIVLVRPAELEGSAALHAAIFESGRLLLLVPPVDDNPAAFGRHMAIAWKVSEPATRAVTAAIPWLRRAERVSVLTVGEHPAFDDIQNLLGGYGITAQPLAIERGDLNVGERLLCETQAIGADCLVMGAYHHHPVGEILFGGVTRHILRRASLPVFMKH